MSALVQFFHFLAVMFPVAATGAFVCLAFWIHNLRKLVTIQTERIDGQGRFLTSQQEQIGLLQGLVARMYLAPLPHAPDRSTREVQWDEFDRAYADFQAIIARLGDQSGTSHEPGS